MADDPRRNLGFVSLKSLTAGAPDPAAALAEIRTIYFNTSRATIDNDFAHAVDLLKSIPDEETRMKAHVYMEGLAEMAREWGKQVKNRKVEAAAKPDSGTNRRRRRRETGGRSEKVEK